MVVQQGRRRDKHRKRNFTPNPELPNSSIPKRGTLRILSSRERSLAAIFSILTKP